MTAPHPYHLDLPGLAEAVAACVPDAKHAALVKTMCAFDEMGEARVATTRGGDGSYYLSRCKVLSHAGVVLHDDHEVWLREQLQADGGDANATLERVRAEGYLFSRCFLTKLYLVSDRGGTNPADFAQATVYLEDERIDRVALSGYVWDKPRTLADLLEIQGDPVDETMKRPVGSPRYRLDEVVDVEAFVVLAERQDAHLRERLRARRYNLTGSYRDGSSDESEVRTHDEMFPGWDKVPAKLRRIFLDWQASSAGRSGERFCDHWALTFSDWTDPNTGVRHLSYVPLWTFDKKLAEIESRKGDCYGHFSKLQTLDRRVKVPFAWYFYMLHGNRVHDGSGQRVLADAEAGLIVLPEHDYRVLKAWSEHPYGF